MSSPSKNRHFHLLALSCMVFLASSQASADDLRQRASWNQPDPQEVKAEFDQWLTEQSATQEQQETIATLWQSIDESSTSPELLTAITASSAVLDSRAERVVQLCQGVGAWLVPPELVILEDASVSPLIKNNLKLLLGGWLAQERLYDESKLVLEGLQPSDVVDPVALLFYRGSACHFLLDRENGLVAISQLLEREDEIPRRYREVARLIQHDLQAIEEESLDEIARLMNDIQRRLELGRSGTRVIDQEDEVIDKLDQMIEALEQQASSSSSSSSSPSGGQPSGPADAPYQGGATGEGAAAPAQLGNTDSWGNLPPQERQEALQQISDEFPSHYREVIQEYFRRIARDGDSP